MSETVFNDLCRRMIRTTMHERTEQPVETETKIEEPQAQPPSDDVPKLSRRERRLQEKLEKKKEKRNEKKKTPKSNVGSLDQIKTNYRVSQFEDEDRARIERILFNR
jgi:hypothetical protein